VKKARGERSGEVPYGWRLGPDGVHLHPEPAEQRILVAARRHQAEGPSLRAIGARLKGAGIAPRSGGRWHPQTVANALQGRLDA
jgi:hypothetical protein